MSIDSGNISLDRLQLTFIPAEYWNNPLSEFNVLKRQRENAIPEDSNFFLLWSVSDQSEQELSKKIKSIFPEIPVDKLISCKIRLALPQNENCFKLASILGKIIPLPPAINLLYRLQVFESLDRSSGVIHYSESIKTWAFITKLIFELINRGNFVPILEKQTDNLYKARWRLLLKTQNDNERFKTILRNSSWFAFNLPINFIPANGKQRYKTDGLWHPSYLLSKYMDNVGDISIRSILKKTQFKTFKDFFSAEILKEKRREIGITWDYKLLKSLITKDNRFVIQKFHENIIPSIVNNWVQMTQGTIYNRGFSFTIELKYPEETEETWPLFFSLTLQDNETYSLKECLEGERKRELIKFCDNEDQFLESILKSLGTAAIIFPPIERALESKFPNVMYLDSTEVMDFLKYPKDLFIQSGYNIILPDVFTYGGRQRLTSRLIIHSKKKKKEKSISTDIPTLFDINSMLNYKWEVSLEGSELTEKELDEMIESDQPLINWRGKWILVDQQDVEDLRRISEEHKKVGTISYMEALKSGLSGNIQLQENGNQYEVLIEGDLNIIIEKLMSIDKFDEIDVPRLFNGTLRPYQKTALIWMANMSELNFGLCLADDMGLGKTIQVLAFLLHRKELYPDDPGSILIISPTSVLFNWTREIKKFAPDLEVVLHHGRERIKDASQISKYTKPHQIILTSYGTLRNDVDLLELIPFKGIIIDEIQNIKNYSSKQTQAVYKLQGQFKIGLSGTPIENRLMELWTLFEFLNPGLLGSRAEFQKNLILPITRFKDQDAIDKLKKIISPFILRRVKTDKSVISDLPEKNEMKVYIELSDIQVGLYKELVEEALTDIKSNLANKINVLNLILKLKQLCNHPYHFLKKTAPSFGNGVNLEDFVLQSQKLERLIEMTEEVISNGEKVLIFTQFTKMAEIIKSVLEAKKFSVLYFHGGVPEKKRRELVDEFQSEDLESSPIMILSLKAGGTGLNLTRGTMVIHYDRWWNPAVENQATDRAYRIGQESQVNVYKFITIGTIEEKIDMLLEEKKDLADKIISSTGESWITELKDEKLRELFTLNI